MRITKKTVVVFVILLICFILRGDIFNCPYYTYKLGELMQHVDAYIDNIFGYLSVYLVFACGFFEIYNVKRLALIFLFIQPAKLIMDVLDAFMSEYLGFRIFYPLLGLALLYILIYLGDLFVGNRKRYKEIIKMNRKYLLKALAISVAGQVAISIIVFPLVNILYIVIMMKMSDDTQMMVCTIIFCLINLLLTICMFVTIILLLKNLFNKIYYPALAWTKTAEISLTVVMMYLPIAHIVYYLTFYINPIFYYIDTLKYIE